MRAINFSCNLAYKVIMMLIYVTTVSKNFNLKTQMSGSTGATPVTTTFAPTALRRFSNMKRTKLNWNRKERLSLLS